MTDIMRALIIVLLSFISFHSASSACTFPSNMEGSWESPEKGAMVVNSTYITGWDVYTGTAYVDMDLECYINSGSRYVLRSGAFTVLGLGNDVKAYTCMDLTQLSTNKYVYNLLTPRLADSQYDRVKFVLATGSATESEICTETAAAIDTKLIVRNGTAASEATQCPNQILGTYYYTNQTACNESYWDVCSTLSMMTFNYTSCATKQAYSAEGVVYCMHSSYVGNSAVFYVYNNDSTVDNTNHYQFTCLVAEIASDGYVYVTQSPKQCHNNQTSTYVLSGTTTVLAANVTCVPTSDEESVSQAGLIAGLVVLFLVLIIAGAVGGYFLYKKKFKKVEPEKQVIDREKSGISSDAHRVTDTVTPSVVQAEVTSPRNGGSHGKLDQVLGREYTMSQLTDDAKNNDMSVQDVETPRKLPPITTGDTPREALSPLDTQMQKPQLPAIP